MGYYLCYSKVFLDFSNRWGEVCPLKCAEHCKLCILTLTLIFPKQLSFDSYGKSKTEVKTKLAFFFATLQEIP